MALKQLYDAWTGKSEDFLRQVGGAALQAARDIENEDPGTANHANRLLWAEAARANPKNTATEMVRDVLRNATIAADVENATDNDVQFVVNSLIDTYATG